ncbi:Ribosomal RNA large subunit methyltransferase H [uncultured archaeon]|nr:Ribosomal RNA large subunit methyltransferase H [uncultured archaeon]
MIKIIAVGRLKEPHYQQAEAEYYKRLRKIEVLEIKESSDKNPEVAIKKEAREIQSKISASSDQQIIALEASGKQVSSEEFAKLIAKKQDTTFLIGGPYGHTQDTLKKADYVLSLSQMTFPHQLARVILAEQIYRAHTIQAGKEYHK